MSYSHFDRKKLPPPGGGVSYSPCSLVKNREEEEPPLKNHPQIWSILRVVLQGGSSSSRFFIRNIVNRKPPRGGGFLSINFLACYCKYQGSKITIYSKVLMSRLSRSRHNHFINSLFKHNIFECLWSPDFSNRDTVTISRLLKIIGLFCKRAL